MLCPTTHLFLRAPRRFCVRQGGKLLWGTVENFSPTSRDLAAGRCINILSGEVRHGEVFIIFWWPAGPCRQVGNLRPIVNRPAGSAYRPQGSPHSLRLDAMWGRQSSLMPRTFCNGINAA